jgi:hypothetical protein
LFFAFVYETKTLPALSRGRFEAIRKCSATISILAVRHKIHNRGSFKKTALRDGLSASLEPNVTKEYSMLTNNISTPSLK